MKSKHFNADEELYVFEIFTDELLEKFSKFNINTVGHLLSATKGLTMVQGLFDSQVEMEILQELKSIIPEEIQSEYANFSFRHSTGLIIPNTDENEKEN